MSDNNQNQMVPIEQVLVNGDLSSLSPEQRLTYYMTVCKSLGLNPLTKPFNYLSLDDGSGGKKLVLYANKDCTDQLRTNRKVSIVKVDAQVMNGVYIATACAQLPDGRMDTSTGVVSIEKAEGTWKKNQNGKSYFESTGVYNKLRGDALANAMMKAETKAKRRATLSICGLGMLDESEIETIKDAQVIPAQIADGDSKPSTSTYPDDVLNQLAEHYKKNVGVIKVMLALTNAISPADDVVTICVWIDAYKASKEEGQNAEDAVIIANSTVNDKRRYDTAQNPAGGAS
ncbi:MAG: hypothetical protein WC455_28470 [Dehalococcoidia bacterium]|jgi:predicted GNAT family acetyltransferase